MSTVHKYPFSIDDSFGIAMPKGAKILLVDVQGNAPCIWAQVDTDAPMVQRRFRLTGTGHPLPDGLVHVGSFQQLPFVWHLWEEAAQ